MTCRWNTYSSSLFFASLYPSEIIKITQRALKVRAQSPSDPSPCCGDSPSVVSGVLYGPQTVTRN